MAKSSRVTLCSFCGKSQAEVKKIIAGPGVYICDSCVNVCKTIIDREIKPAAADAKPAIRLIKPAEIKRTLDDFVIGQDHAKKVLSVAVYNHYKRLQFDSGQSPRESTALSPEFSEVEVEKSNILLSGPTGSGKTLLARTLARILDVPFAISDATTLTEAGYVGEDVENVVLRLLQAANYDVKRAECGIIYIDEIDKIASSSNGSGRDVSGRGVQTTLLKLMEETEVPVRNPMDLQAQLQAAFETRRGGGGSKHESINTRHILFIVSGAFDKLDDQVRQRFKQSRLGFAAEPATLIEDRNLLHETTTQDFIAYGMEPEFIGRLPVRVVCDPLNADDLFEILKRSEGSIIRQYERAFQAYGIEVLFEDGALRRIAERAQEEKTGARGLLTVCERLLRDYKYELPDSGVRSFSVGESLVDHPAEVLRSLLESGHAEKEKSLAAIVEQFAERFRAQHEIQISFEPETAQALVQRALAEDAGVRELCETLFRDYQFGLQLIRKNSGRRDFAIPRRAVDDPDGVLSDWVVESYRQARPDEAGSPPSP